ncbi:MAG TPA: hypothetical protein VF467_03230 [Afipia sp.]
MSVINAIAADEIEKDRELIILAMASSIGRSSGSTATETLTAVASALLDATIAELRGDTSSAAALTELIDRSEVAQFGDSLLAILKDVIGHGLPPSAFSRVGDAYWRMIKSAGVPTR